jgi:PIN like domain
MGSRRNKSKRPSGTSLPPERRLESTVFFVDRSLGDEIVPEALRKAGLRIEAHKDHFAQGALDVEWIAKCAENGWVALASDKAIKRNLLERTAIINGCIAGFFLTSGSRTGPENAEIIVKALKRIANMLDSEGKPFIARIHPDGKVELWVNRNNKDMLTKERLSLAD